MNTVKMAATLTLLASLLPLAGCHKAPAPNDNATGTAQDQTPGGPTAGQVGSAMGRAASGAVQAGEMAASAAHSALQSSERAVEDFRNGMQQGFSTSQQKQ